LSVDKPGEKLEKVLGELGNSFGEGRLEADAKNGDMLETREAFSTFLVLGQSQAACESISSSLAFKPRREP